MDGVIVMPRQLRRINGKIVPSTTSNEDEDDRPLVRTPLPTLLEPEKGEKSKKTKLTRDQMRVAAMVAGNTAYAVCTVCNTPYSTAKKGNRHDVECMKKVNLPLKRPCSDPTPASREKRAKKEEEKNEATYPVLNPFKLSTTIKILSYNLWFDAICIPQRMQGVVAIVHETKPDVLLFQEVTLDMLDCVEPLLEAIGFTLVCDGLDETRSYAEVIFLRQDSVWTQVQRAQCNSFENSSMHRCLQIITLVLKENQYTRILVGTAHLESLTHNGQTRRAQLQTCFSLLGEDTTCPFVLGGDTNLGAGDDKVLATPENIEDAWISCGSDPQHRYTWDTTKNNNLECGFYARCRFDRFYCSKSLVRTTEFCTVGKHLLDTKPRELYCSDHWGIMATMSIARSDSAVAAEVPLPIVPPLPKLIRKRKRNVEHVKPRPTLDVTPKLHVPDVKFAIRGWKPNPEDTYSCSYFTSATDWTPLMAMVLSGRDQTTGKLVRQDELDGILANPEFSAIECRRVNSEGWTALMLAARNSRSNSTEATVAQLLAHESGSEVARVRISDGKTALILAAQSAGSDSTEATVAQLLAHESGSEVARMRTNDGSTALSVAVNYSRSYSTEATVAQLLAHESGSEVARMRIGDKGATALMWAAQNAGSYSTEATVTQLLAHESGSEVARMKTIDGDTALMMAARNSRSKSTDATVAQLLAHESGSEVARMTDKNGWTALVWALVEGPDSTEETVLQLLSHESGREVARMKTSSGWTAWVFANGKSRSDNITQATIAQLLAYEMEIKKN